MLYTQDLADSTDQSSAVCLPHIHQTGSLAGTAIILTISPRAICEGQSEASQEVLAMFE